jgi:hypothetical protein
MSQSANATSSSDVSAVFGVVTDGQTYRNLLYLVLAFPLGVAYYVVLTVGFALGLGLSVLLIGLGVLFVTVVGVRGIASFERGLANRLLRTEIPAPDDVKRDGDGPLAYARAYLRAGSTWRGLGFVFLKFWIGILSFVLLVSFLGTAVELLLLPVVPDGALNVQVFGWEVPDTFGTPTRRAIAVPIGAALAVAALHVLNAFAEANASIASSLLGGTPESEA